MYILSYRVFPEKDQGIYDAYNKGWRLAKGEWIYYMGSDDALTEDGLFCHMKFADDANDKVGTINGGIIRVTKDGRHRAMMCKGFWGSHQGMVMRKSAINELGGFNLEYKFLADYDMFVKMRDSHYDVVNTNQIIAFFRAGGASEKLSNIVIVFNEKLSILRKDKSCRTPLLITIKETIRSLLGKVRHGM